MVDKDIKKQCKTVRLSFLSTLTQDVEAAAFMLGNLYRHRQSAKKEEIALINDTLKELKQKITVEQISKLWQGMHAFRPDRWKVMDEGTKESLHALKRGMLQDLDFVKGMKTADLVILGQHPIWYREALIALVRQHLLAKRQIDPFNNGTFSFDLLLQGGPEQNYLYLSGYLQQCVELPVNLIVEMGKSNPQIAAFIMLDCQSHASFFEISRQFIEIDSLRKGIAKFWKSYIEHYALSPAQIAYLENELPKLKEYSEFKDISLNTRIEGHYTSNTFELASLLTPETFDLASLTVMGPTALYLSSGIFAHGASIVSFAAGLAGGATTAKLGSLALGVLWSAPQVAIPLLLYAAIAYKAEGWFKGQKKEESDPEKMGLACKL